MTSGRRTKNVARHTQTAVAVAFGAWVGWTAITSDPSSLALHPGPHLTAAQVVRIQVDALGTPDHGEDGIAVAFRFASPRNRARTGPISDFASMIRSNPYGSLLDNVSVEYGRTLTRGSRSYTALIVTDRRGVSSAFMWVLTRQGAGSCTGCWLTDSVVPVGDMRSLKFA